MVLADRGEITRTVVQCENDEAGAVIYDGELSGRAYRADRARPPGLASGIAVYVRGLHERAGKRVGPPLPRARIRPRAACAAPATGTDGSPSTGRAATSTPPTTAGAPGTGMARAVQRVAYASPLPGRRPRGEAYRGH